MQLSHLTGRELDDAIRRIVLARPLPVKLVQKIADAPLVPLPRIREPVRLTPARLQVLKLVVCGLTNDEIAEALERSPETIKTQVRQLIRIAGVRNRTHLAALAVACGVVRTYRPRTTEFAAE